MQILELLDNAPGGASAKNLAAAFGVDPAKAAPAVQLMAQALADRIERNTLSRGGIADMADLVSRPGLGRALREPQNLASPAIENLGNSVLDSLVGSRHWSRGVAAKAARESGLDEEALKKMLPAIASMLIGAIQQKSLPQIEKLLSSAPSLAAELRGRSPLPLPGERPLEGDASPHGGGDIELPKPAGSTAGGIGGTVGGGRSGGGAESGPIGGSPLPLPGDHIPGIDDAPSRFPRLPDIVRRGGPGVPYPDDDSSGDTGSGGPIVIPGGGSLDQIIRQILANVLGFRNGGILSWIINLLLSRWFLGLAGRILKRVIAGR